MTPTLDALQQAFMQLLAPAVQPGESGTRTLPESVPPSTPQNATPGAVPSGNDLIAATPAATLPSVSAPAPLPPPAPCRIVDPKTRGFHFDASVAPDQVAEAARLLDAQGFALDTITGVDWMANGEMEVVYDYFHPVSPLHIVVRTRIPRERPELPTIGHVFAGAWWHERETHDFFGIRFLGNPDLTPLLLPEDADFHPLLKDFPGVT